MLSSPDGNNWSTLDSGTLNDLASVAYGNGVFVTVGKLGTILTSHDTSEWTRRNSGTSHDFYGVKYLADGLFVAVGEVGTMVTSAPSVPRFESIGVLSDGAVETTLTGSPGQGYLIQVSPNLITWEPLTNIFLENGTGTFVHRGGSNSSHFFRAAVPP